MMARAARVMRVREGQNTRAPAVQRMTGPAGQDILDPAAPNMTGQEVLHMMVLVGPVTPGLVGRAIPVRAVQVKIVQQFADRRRDT